MKGKMLLSLLFIIAKEVWRRRRLKNYWRMVGSCG